ncbi:MAG: hypothetical protein MJZ81_07525 [Bacteroidales bacterium]|nr:hypothetical protein [Bacteroidales bacterium]
MKIDRELIWSLTLDQLGDFYSEVLKENDTQMIRSLILADRYFLLTMVLDVKVAWHPWVLARCREVERDPDEHLDLWSRGHFKSTIITYAGVSQYVLQNPENAVCLMSYKAGAAEAFATQIRQAFETNDILNACFPDILWGDRIKDAPSWSNSDFTIKRRTGRKEASVSTSGLVTGMRTGGHYDLLVYDDTVTPESVTTPDQIERTTNAWSMSLNLGTIDGTRHWYIGTRYDMYDTYDYMLKLGTIKERRHICIDEDGRSVLLPQEELDRKRAEMTVRDWNSQMLQTPIGEGQLLMKEEWFHTYDRYPDIPMNIYVFADTAQRQSKKSDYTVMWVVGYGSDKRKYVLDGIYDKINQSQRWARLSGLVEKWTPACVFYEENAAPDDCEYFRRQMSTFGHFDLKGFRQKSTSGAKELRIETLQPEFEQGLWWFPQKIMYRMSDGKMIDVVDFFKRNEFLSFPQVVHDDGLDCLANTSAGNEDITPFVRYPTIKRRPQLGAVDSERMAPRSDDVYSR